MLDLFLSSAEHYPFAQCYGFLFVLAPFFGILLFLNPEEAKRLAGGIVLISALQAVIAIFYYAYGIQQYVTPHFGNRTGGTFHQPNTLYPLCILTFPLALMLGRFASTKWERWAFRIAAAALLLALFFTYQRAGWIALGVSLLSFAALRASPLPRSARYRIALSLVGLSLCLGAVLIRTGGSMIGNRHDRSFWGRFAIWQVSLDAFAQHPGIGTGLATFQEEQSAHMTAHLRSFNPLNGEAKSFFLNVGVECGLLGLVPLAVLLWRYRPLYRAGISQGHQPEYLVGIHLGLLALLITCFFDTPILFEQRAADTFVLVSLLGILAVIVQHGAPCEQTELSTLRLRRNVCRVLLWTACATVGILFLFGTAGYIEAQNAMPALDRLTAKWQKNIGGSPTDRAGKYFPDMLIAGEDANFYAHSGVDWEALHRAFRRDLRAFRLRQGGSTLTMQAVRYCLLSGRKTPDRKVAEILLAYRLEKTLSKDQILALYMNVSYFGLHAYGVRKAAMVYFHKSPTHLTLAEAGFLVGCLSAPRVRPEQVTAGFAQNCQQRALDRLQAYYSWKYSKAELQAARHETLHFAWEAASISLPRKDVP